MAAGVCALVACGGAPEPETPDPEVVPAAVDAEVVPVPEAPAKPLLEGSGQLVVVLTADWDASYGVMRRYHRAIGKWIPFGHEVPVRVGENGLAWGAGLSADPLEADPLKLEGDGRSPAGLFTIDGVFGVPTHEELGGEKGFSMPYFQVTPTLECVTDEDSPHYNQLVDREAVEEIDWEESVKIEHPGDTHKWGVVLGHNTATNEPGDGACTFLHAWEKEGESSPTGDTTVSKEHVEETAKWLDRRAKPRLVQLPLDAYERVHNDWGMPGSGMTRDDLLKP